MKVFNTLTRKKKNLFRYRKERSACMCADHRYITILHIGNARPMIVFDTVRRYFEYKGYDVNYVSNFTDVDDKIIKKAMKKGSMLL